VQKYNVVGEIEGFSFKSYSCLRKDIERTLKQRQHQRKWRRWSRKHHWRFPYSMKISVSLFLLLRSQVSHHNMGAIGVEDENETSQESPLLSLPEEVLDLIFSFFSRFFLKNKRY